MTEPRLPVQPVPYTFKEGDPIYIIRGEYAGAIGTFVKSAVGIATVKVNGETHQVDSNDFRLHPRPGYVMVPLADYEELMGTLEEWSQQLKEQRDSFVTAVANVEVNKKEEE